MFLCRRWILKILDYGVRILRTRQCSANLKVIITILVTPQKGCVRPQANFFYYLTR